MATIKFELKESKKNDDGKAPVYMRFTVGSSRSYKSTDIWIKPSRWNNDRQEVRKTQSKNDASETYNAILANLRSKAKEVIREFTAENKVRELQGKPIKKITPQLIKKTLFDDEKPKDHTLFIAFARKVQRRTKKEKSYNTYLFRNTVINKFEEYLGDHPGVSGSDIPFEDITVSLIKDYYAYLVDDVGNALNTAKKNIGVLTTFHNKAIAEELVDHRHAPFRYVSFPSKETKKEHLTPSEINKIQKLQLEKGSTLWHVRNYFFFQMYTAGLRVSDLCVLTWDAIHGQRFEYTMRKTDSHKSLILVEPALNILSHYRPAREGELIFPILKKPVDQYEDEIRLVYDIRHAGSDINAWLKEIKRKVKLTKNLTTHMARHTFANAALKNGWTMHDIQKALGHSSITTTERYLSYFDQDSIDKNMRNLFESDDLTSVA